MENDYYTCVIVAYWGEVYKEVRIGGRAICKCLLLRSLHGLTDGGLENW